MNTVKALALFDGLDFVTPDHVQEMAVMIIAHRLSVDPQARFSGRSAEAVVEEIVASLPVPA
jgi:MoxR-like ATPase